MFNKLSFHQLFCFFAWSTSDYNICAIYTSTIEINISKLRKPFVRLSICFQKLWSLSESWELVGMEKNWSELGTYSRACKICYSFESRLELWSLVVLKVAPNFKAGRNSEAEFKTINVGRGYVINVGRGYVRNDKGRHRAARAAKKEHLESFCQISAGEFSCRYVAKFKQKCKNDYTFCWPGVLKLCNFLPSQKGSIIAVGLLGAWQKSDLTPTHFSPANSWLFTNTNTKKYK